MAHKTRARIYKLSKALGEKYDARVEAGGVEVIGKAARIAGNEKHERQDLMKALQKILDDTKPETEQETPQCAPAVGTQAAVSFRGPYGL